MDNVFKVERGTNNVLLVGVEQENLVYGAKSALDGLVPYYFSKVIVVPGLKGAYMITR